MVIPPSGASHRKEIKKYPLRALRLERLVPSQLEERSRKRALNPCYAKKIHRSSNLAFRYYYYFNLNEFLCESMQRIS